MKLNLVIVDDSAIWLSIAEKLALAHPDVANVTTFDDSLDAWIYLQTNQSTALMTDIEMPCINGFSFLSMFSAKLPIITTSTRKNYAGHAKEFGCVGFLSKPFSKKDFNLALTNVHERISFQKIC
ncbi:LytR/AlgR family response regulator transcription factor [Maribacter sp. IgM3_T14_3]|uniref:LytR/AlgR family response regulator transcription factor n=1 Tax=Maribacter sp. IgM3_T14_3 TaxID=3415140 RepID=UPI003C6F6ECC